MDVSHLRRDYSLTGLDEADALADPFAQFQSWFADVLEADRHDPTAMTLATADREGRPSARIVLLKGYDERGFVFFTNYGSRKGRELEENPRAALVFYWPDFDRQVRVEGTVERASREESEEYFRSRPRGSRLGAWASPQSTVIAGREDLERRLREVEERFPAGDTEEVPTPDFWGGYRLRPEVIEFWQGRPSRLHDRLRYSRLPEGGWKIERLSP
ncbi:MAG TPA: pyridoxamine 5'-phosphate oxidase [Thermoanaerobaculia bacterium]|nr:pyridoxamine 5'-phosphate oxidase [Thermoanaerobaculia bacterium]